MKIRGGPWSMDQVHEVVHGPGPSWGGPWTPVHVLYMPDFYNTLSVNLIGNTVKYAREYDYSAPLGSEFILNFRKFKVLSKFYNKKKFHRAVFVI